MPERYPDPRSRAVIRRPSARDCQEFLALLYNGFLVRIRETDKLVGVINLNNITRGAIQSAYLGFYALAPYEGKGHMQEGLGLVLKYAFTKLKLHRLEANIQSGNARSLALVKRCGFTGRTLTPVSKDRREMARS